MSALFNKWVWLMAWRDGRASRKKLLLFSTSIILGIAALVAAGSLGANLREAVAEQSKTLLGADLAIGSREPLTQESEKLIAAIPAAAQSRQTSFNSMLQVTKTGETRMVNVRALSPGFPFYGALETIPIEASSQLAAGRILLEESLMTQFGLKPGDAVALGEKTFTIAGALEKIPGESVVMSALSPRVYISMDDLGATHLIRPGSLARYKVYFKLPPDADPQKLVLRLRPRLDKLRLESETVENRKENLGNAMQNLQNYLSLGALVALLLGGIGIASAIQMHMRAKIPDVAVLRCLGSSAAQTTAIYCVQGIMLAAFGSLVGAAIGISVQKILPHLLADLVPVQIAFRIAWSSVALALAASFGFCVLFVLIPLAPFRRISPLAALRSRFEPHHLPKDGMVFFLYALLTLGIAGFSIWESDRPIHGLAFAGGIGAVLLVLAVVARIVIFATRKIIVPAWPYTLRQGLSNMFRPQNQTLLLLVILGFGTFLILALFASQQILVHELMPESESTRANAVLFDIQPDQLDGLRTLLKEEGLPVIQEAAMVTMRLSAIKGVPVERLLRKSNKEIAHWALRREYRSTSRNALAPGETTVSGQWPVSESTTPVISVEEGLLNELHIGIGDELTFDVQGVPISAKIVHVRKVDWRRMQPNFFVVFEPRSLEGAPAFHVLTTRVGSPEKSAQMQRTIVHRFPNITAIDLSIVVQTIQNLVSKIASVVQFMSSFTVITGGFVLFAAILTGRFQRLRESVLLRTLGASRKQVMTILAIEYACIGLLSAVVGMICAEAAAWGLARFLFEIPFELNVQAMLATLVLVPLLTLAAGVFSSFGILKRSPLAVLRSEG
jgi:putative ABC transport system permease protein